MMLYIKRFIFTAFLVAINAGTVWAVFFTPDGGEMLLPFIFFFLLLVAYTLSFWSAIVNSRFVKKTIEILGNILLTGCFFYLTYLLVLATITGGIPTLVKFSSRMIHLHEDPGLFYTVYLINLIAIITLGSMGWASLKSIRAKHAEANK